MLGIVTAVSCARTLESHSSGVYRTPREFHYDAVPKFLVLNTNAKYGFECPAPRGRVSVCMNVYFVLPLSAFNLSLAPACAAASRAVSTRNGEQAT